MKKSILCMMAVAAVLTSCDPVSSTFDFDPVSKTAEQVGECISFQVWKDAEHTQAAGQAEGNYVTYTTNPATIVTILQGSKVLATGASGSFPLSPKRGSTNDQEVTVRVVNSDNSVVDATKIINVWVKSDLDPEYKLLLGEAGVKSWMWDFNAPTGATCWGNGGNTGNGSAFAARTVDGHWWGVSTPEDLLEQLQHSDTKAPSGEEASGAYMTFDEDNQVVVYGADGTIIRKGSYEIKGWDPTRASGWQIGTLSTPESAILFPFSINEDGKKVTDFDIMYLDQNHMTLVYTKGNGAGSWGEITHWMFKNCSPSVDLLEATTTWGWANDGVECWGNAGNSGNGAGYTYNAVDGKWWGVKSASELTGQLQHSEGGVDHGDCSDDAYMVFSHGTVASYKADGSEIRSAKYALNINAGGRVGGWELGKLTTTGTALLFPYSINEGGKPVTEFDVMYMDADNMTLVYTKGNGSGSWGEITYWRFAAK